MDTQPTQAVASESPVEQPLSLDDRLMAALTDEAPTEQVEEQAEAIEEEGEQPETPESEEAEDELEIEAEEDELPPIEAPVSWDAEAKAKFAELPRELQETVTKREAERERFVQQKSQEAARVAKETEQAAIQQLAQIERNYADQYQSIAQQFDVPEPDLSLLATDQMQYFAQLQAHRNAQAQRQQAQQVAEHYAQQAQQREAQAEQAYHAEQHKLIIETFPEYADPTTGPKIQQELSTVARELGYTPDRISQAEATDILAMKKAAEWKAKADQYDRLQAKKMEKVREAKKLPKVAKPGSAQAPGAASQNQIAADRKAMREGDAAATQRIISQYF